MGNLTGRVSVTFAVLLALLLGVAAPARADETMSAKEHYNKGTSYYDLGRYAYAITEFEAAYQIKNDPAILYNLAQSHRLAGNAEQALRFYKTYLRRAPKGPFKSETESFIAQLEQLVSQKNASQSAPPKDVLPPSGTTTTTPSSPEPAPAPPNVTPIVPPPGAPPPGAPPAAPTTPDVYNTAPVVPSPAPRGAAPSTSVGRALRIAGIAGMATGGLFVIIGAIEGGRAVGAANEINDAGKKGGTFDPAVETRGKNAVAAEKGFIVTGLLVGAAGGVLYYLGYRQYQEASVAVTPMASINTAGASLRVSF
jgi:tetratricopeptide (TPR) repeat protein